MVKVIVSPILDVPVDGLTAMELIIGVALVKPVMVTPLALIAGAMLSPTEASTTEV